jgi:hypothetical protein
MQIPPLRYGMTKGEIAGMTKRSDYGRGSVPVWRSVIVLAGTGTPKVVEGLAATLLCGRFPG